MATDKLINSTQGDDIIGALNDIADNVGNITYGPQTSSDKVVSMLGYAEAAEAASINPGDTLNVAIGKLEKKANDNATNVANKIDKLTNATAGDIATVTATGEIADSTVSIADSNTGLADSDTAVPTSKTVKTYVDSTATGISRYLGTITAASGLSTSAKKGDFYVVKTAWTGVHAGDEIIAEKDGPAQTIDGTNWSLLHNEADTDTKYTFATGDSNGTFKVTPSDTGTAQSVPIKGLGSAAYTTADTSSLTNDNNHVPTSALAKSLLDAKVPTTRKVNNKALSSDITLSASDVSAVPSSNVTTTLPASSAAASTSKVMSEKLVYDNYVQNSDFVVAEQNINYAINTGVKNWLPIDHCNFSAGAYVLRNYELALPADNYVFYIKTTSATATGVQFLSTNGVDTGDNRTGIVTIYNPSGTQTANVTVATGTTHISLYVNDAAVIPEIMLCPKSLWDTFDHTFQKGALPNSDLTVLEAEDRASLAEVVDFGSKNLLDFANLQFQTQGGTTYTKTDTDITVTSSRAWAACTYKMPLSAGNYVFSAKISDLSIGTGGSANICLDTQPDGHGSRAASIVVEQNGTVSGAFTWGGGTLYIMYYPNYTATAITTTFKASENMICTKAAFCVSSKFVPYRPNWDLVCQVAYAGGYTGVSSPNADLNDISTSEFRVYNNPSNMPSGTSGYCWVRTNVVDINSALQEMTLLSTDSNSYVRVKAGGTWRAWKQTTNA